MCATAADFMDKYEADLVDRGALMWCEGPKERIGRREGTRRRNLVYKAMVILNTRPLGKGGGRRRSYLRELTAPNATQLAKQFRAEGLQPPPRLKQSCESAGTSPRILDD